MSLIDISTYCNVNDWNVNPVPQTPIYTLNPLNYRLNKDVVRGPIGKYMYVNDVIWSQPCVLVWAFMQILPQNIYKEMQLKKTQNSNAQDK